MRRPIQLSRRRLLAAGLAWPASGLVGCVVAPYGTYWRPVLADAGGRERRAWCGGQAGPVTGAELDLGGGISLQSVADKPRDGSVAVRTQLKLPAGIDVQLPDPIRVTVDGRRLDVPVQLAAHRALPLAAGAWIDPQRLRPGTRRQPSLSSGSPFGRAELRITGPAGSAAPQVTVDGLRVAFAQGSVALPPMAMVRSVARRSPDSYRSGQQQSLALARTEACRRDTPNLACDNLLDFVDTSDAGEQDGVSWTGRWYRSPLDALEGELALAVRQPGRWQLLADDLRVREAGGPSRPLALSGASLAFADRVSPGETLAPAPAPTTVLLETFVPASASHFELQFGALRAAGQPIDLPPVRFERRTLDAGVEPFNC